MAATQAEAASAAKTVAAWTVEEQWEAGWQAAVRTAAAALAVVAWVKEARMEAMMEVVLREAPGVWRVARSGLARVAAEATAAG